MGACGSKPKGCVGMKSKLKFQSNYGRRRRIRRVKKTRSLSQKINKVEPANSMDLSFDNPAFQGNGELWFDPSSVIGSDGEDEFYSVQDDMSQAGSVSTGVTPRFANNVHFNTFDSCLKPDDPQNEIGSSHNCRRLSNALVACLACDESFDRRRKMLNPISTSLKKKVSLTHSFKRKEGNANRMSPSSRAIVRRPIAGSQITCSPLEKEMSDSWSRVEPNTFTVRGRSFLRDKKKDFAQNYDAFEPFGADVFLSPRKIDHIARFVELPSAESSGEIPPILIINLQIPLYPAAIFQNEHDGEGMNFVFYFKLSENYSDKLPLHFQENVKRIIHNETEKIKAFPVDTNVPLRERLKILGRIVNVDGLQLSSAERKLMHAYNEKPVLSRPQHNFYLGGNYFEIDLDIHRFSYIARKGFEAFRDRIDKCIFDFGMTIQGNKAEDLPEHMLCCIRMKEIDYKKYSQLSI